MNHFQRMLRQKLDLHLKGVSDRHCTSNGGKHEENAKARYDFKKGAESLILCVRYLVAENPDISPHEILNELNQVFSRYQEETKWFDISHRNGYFNPSEKMLAEVRQTSGDD